MGFSRQEYWSGLPLPSPGDLPDPGIEPRSPTLQADAFNLCTTRLTSILLSGQNKDRISQKMSCGPEVLFKANEQIIHSLKAKNDSILKKLTLEQLSKSVYPEFQISIKGFGALPKQRICQFSSG